MPRTALNIVLGWGTPGAVGAGSYALHVTQMTNRANRMPSVIPFPLSHRHNEDRGETDSSETGRVETAAFDFGLLEQNIIITGYIPDVEPDPAHPEYWPTQPQLENKLRTAWKYLDFELDYTAILNGLMVLNYASDVECTAYGILPQDWEFTRVGGQNKWSFRLTFIVAVAPEDMAGTSP
jgi:hypothetical protein